MPISIICAISFNNCIGKNNKLPWHIPEDLAHFKKLTLNQTVLMGTKTFQSILDYLGKPLPKRNNVLVTRNKNYQTLDDVRIFHDLDEALKQLKNENLFICGGASIYKQTIDKADKLYITHVHKEVDGDTFFPKIDKNVWQEVEREDHKKFSFVTYKRI